jgi:hypothetical protein
MLVDILWIYQFSRGVFSRRVHSGAAWPFLPQQWQMRCFLGPCAKLLIIPSLITLGEVSSFLARFFFCASTNFWSKEWLDNASKALSLVFWYLSVPTRSLTWTSAKGFRTFADPSSSGMKYLWRHQTNPFWICLYPQLWHGKWVHHTIEYALVDNAVVVFKRAKKP